MKKTQRKLFQEVEAGHVSSVIKILQEHPTIVNIKDNYDGWTALMHASDNGHLPCVEALLGAGADPNIQESISDETALMMA